MGCFSRSLRWRFRARSAMRCSPSSSNCCPSASAAHDPGVWAFFRRSTNESMTDPLLKIITSQDDAIRNASLDSFCRDASPEVLLAGCATLDEFRRTCSNLYQRVRALFFLYAIHRFHLPPKLPATARGSVPFDGYNHLLSRRFEEAVDVFLVQMQSAGPSDAI